MAEINVKFTPPDLIPRMQRYPDRLKSEMEKTTTAALAHTQGSVPQYPAARPSSSYVRTGTLGRSIGLGGRADIYEVRAIGSGYEGKLGTNLSYAPYVISEDQAAVHRGRWWTVATILEKAKPGIMRLYEAMAKRMVDFLGS